MLTTLSRYSTKILLVLLITMLNLISACAQPTQSSSSPGIPFVTVTATATLELLSALHYGQVNVPEVIVRAGASETSPEITRLPYGAIVTIMARQGDWMRVAIPETSSNTGWALAEFLDITQSPPTATATLAPKPTATLMSQPASTNTPAALAQKSTSQPTTDPQATPATFLSCTISPPQGWVSCPIYSGDTVFSLAQNTRTTIDQIMHVNCLANPANIQAGRQLYLPTCPLLTEPIPTPTPPVVGYGGCLVYPPPSWVSCPVYIGDKISYLANDTGTTEEQIREVNCLSDAPNIQEEGNIYLPRCPLLAPLTPSPTPFPHGCPINPPPDWVSCPVHVGDTVFSLAQNAGTTINQIMHVNCLTNPSNIQAGRQIYLPRCPLLAPPTPAETPTLTPPTAVSPTPVSGGCIISPSPDWVLCTVKFGDTIFRLSQNTGATVDQIMHVNCLANPSHIQAGRQIYLPRCP